MPDGDIVHSGLSGIYQKLYRILCEGKLEHNECTWIAMRAFLNMQAQVRTLDSLLGISDQPWETLTKKFPILDDIVDQTAVAENLLPGDMRNRLIQLYQSYVSEWDAVESQIAEGLLNKEGDQKASSRYVVSSQQS
ncbi:MAG: hypothetical protein QNJ36_22265 [Calothrix sp. MO_167.B42]|nr:hypothetical protein [Calothrix sp. MO_167.B42]